MTTDDLRTRAEMVAKRVWPDRWDAARITYPHAALQHYRRGAFVQGALWHAAQQPTREQVAEVLWNRANRWDPAMMPFNHLSSVECEYWMKDADAVLALWDGAGS